MASGAVNIQKIDSFASDSTKNYGFQDHENIPVREAPIPLTKPETKSKPVLNIPLSIRPVEVENWQTILLLLTFFMLAFVKAFNSTRFNESVKALFNYSLAEEIVREEKVFFHQVNLLATLIHLITTSLLVFYLREYLNEQTESNIVVYSLIAGFLFLLYLVKYIGSQILFFIFNSNSLATEYIFNVSLYNGLLGSLLIPVLCFLYFTPFDPQIILNYLLIPLLLLIFCWRLLRLFVIGKEKGISYFYIFLYICTLEILPLVVLYRIFIHK